MDKTNTEKDFYFKFDGKYYKAKAKSKYNAMAKILVALFADKFRQVTEIEYKSNK